MEFTPFKSLEVYLQSLVEAKLWVKVIIALMLGALVGFLLSPTANLVHENISEPIGNWLALPGKLFLKLVQMIMIPLIFASIITGLVSSAGEQLKKLGINVGIYFIITTALSIAISMALAYLLNPGSYFGFSKTVDLKSTMSSEIGLGNIPNAISELIPGNPLASMVSGEMLAVVIFTIIIGIAITQLKTEQKNPVIKVLNAIQQICMTIVKWAMKLVPLAVFGLIAQLVSTIGFESLKGIGMYIITVILGLLLLLIVYTTVALIFNI